MTDLENFDLNEGADDEDWGYDDEYLIDDEDSLKFDEKKEFALSDKYYSSITRKVPDTTISEEFLEFFYSYGYDCRKYFNLCVIDPQTIAFVASNLIQFFDFEENKVWFRIGSKGNGIGHITKNPVRQHIAVGANGTDPTITIYNWPLMQVLTVLRGGTTKRYFHLAYSPDGLLLASQGGEPDYFISLWEWKRSTIILQCKSHVHDVHNITFSKYLPGHLTTSGLGHIKFWKMSRTFTGLKLKGEIGKFGNTEISDIIAIHPMPDETVISGCEWGNILLWDDSLIKLETCKRNKQTSHAGYITQFEYISGELISVGSDGWIRYWFYDTIDHADLADDQQYLEIQPIYEFEIADGEEPTMLMCIQKQEPQRSEQTHWYAQDGNGGVWLLDLCTSKKEHEQQKIFKCHAGPIVDMDTADWGPYIATLDGNGNLHIYNYIEKKLILNHKFRDKGSQVIWLPCENEKTGMTLVCGFENGTVRMISVDIQAANENGNMERNYSMLIQVIKPHSEKINVMSLNKSCSLLVTGSNDATIFVLKIDTPDHYPTILPIGYVKVPSSVSCMTWNPQEEATLLIGCLKGDFVEVKLPTEPQPYTKTTYELVRCKPVSFKFESVKSSIEREAIRKKHEEEMEQVIEEKRKELEQLRIENPHITIDEETFLMDIEEKELVLPELYIPEVPNRVLTAQYNINGDIWLFMGGYDAGYVYEYPRPLSGKLKHSIPTQSRIMEYAKNTEIYNFFFDENKKYIFLGTEYGELHIIKVRKWDPLDFSNCLIVPIHDYYNGHMSKILLSYDRKMLITCGHDGNIFSFKINEESIYEEHEWPTTLGSLYTPQKVEDIEDADHPNLEEVITRIEHNRIMALAKKKKEHVLEVIHDLTEEYTKITTRNKYLLQSQQITQFELDPRIVEDLEQQLKAHKILTQRKLEFKVEKTKLELEKLMNHLITPITSLPFAVYGILNEEKLVHSIRELKLDTDSILRCKEMLKHQERREKIDMELQLKLDNVDGRQTISVEEEEIEEEKPEIEMKEVEHLEGLLAEDFSDLTTGLGLQINQTLAKYKENKSRLIRRKNEWKRLHEKKPNLVKSRAKDEATLEKAKETIGEFHLKINEELNLTRKKETAATKYKQFVNCRTKIHNLRESYNSRLKAVAVEKERLQKEIIKLTEVLKRIHMEIPLKHTRSLPQPPKIDIDVEFPEQNLELGKYVSMSEKMEQVKRQRQSSIIDQLIDHSDLEYEALYCDDKGIREDVESLHSIVISSRTKIKDHPSIAADVLRSLNVSDSVQTPWEREAKRSRLWRKIYEQDCILRYIESSYKKLENELDELEEYRLDIIYQSTYMNLNLLTLYEEFLILRESETMELALEDKVNQKLNERLAMIHKIQATNTHIAARDEVIHGLHINIKDTTAEFSKAIADNKFQEFLQKIYKKKYTAAKKQTDESDTGTQSTDTSTEESDGTIDTEAEYIPFDENICPPGCEKELYDMAFSMRKKRYAYEFQIKEEQREIEILQKELDTDSKHLRIIENNVKSCEEELQSFVLSKQKKLNNINTTVVLKVHQLQHILDSDTVTDIQHCVLFNKKELAKLYDRVGELQEETFNLEDKRKKSEIHLKRIKYDLKYMQTQNRKLEGDIKEKMIQKFGQRVSLINLYETILQRLIYDTKTDVQSLMKSYAKEIKGIKWDYNEGLVVLENLIRENTEKLSLLTVLEQEKYKLTKILEQPLISEENMIQVEMEHKADIAVLENILYHKLQQKQMLQYDIQNLKTGARKLPPICLEQSAL